MKKIWPFLFRFIVVVGLTFSPSADISSAAGIETGSYHENFSSYTYLDYSDQAQWDIFDSSLHLQRSNGVLANYGYEHTATAWDLSGHVYVAWTDSREVLNANYLQKLDANGNRLWQADVFIGTGDLPALATGADGSVLAAWRSGLDVLVQKFMPDGTEAWADALSLTSDGRGSYPRIAAAGSGAFWVMWQEHVDSLDPQTGFPTEYRIAKIDGNGVVLVGPLALSDQARSFSVFTGALVVDGVGRAWAAWTDSRVPDMLKVYLQAVAPDGTRLFAQELDLGQGNEPSLARSSNGVVLGWQGNGLQLEKINLSGQVEWSLVAPTLNSCQASSLSSDSSQALWAASICDGRIEVMKFSEGGEALWSQPVVVRKNVSGQATGISLDASGTRAALAWSDNRAENKQVRLQMVSSSGQAGWPVDRLVNDTPGSALQELADLAVAPDGSRYIAWKDNRRGQYNLYLQKLSAAGERLWGSDIMINEPTQPVTGGPRIVLDEQGRLFAAWAAKPQGLFAQRFDENGNKLWPEALTFAPDAISQANRPALAPDPEGGYAAAWQNSSGIIYLQRFTAEGQARWATPAVVATTGLISYEIQLALTPTARAVIAWPDQNLIFAHSLDADGQPVWAAPVPLLDTPMHWGSYGQAVAMDLNGNAYVVWADGYTGLASTQKLSPSGQKLWNSGSPLVVGTTVQMAPGMALDAGGQPLFTLMQTSGFRAYLYSSDGDELWQAEYTNGYGGYTARFPALMGDAIGNLDIVWEDLSRGNWDIFMNSLISTGEFTMPQPAILVDPDEFTLQSGSVISGTIDTLSGPITEANLTSDEVLSGGQVVYSLTNDGGQTWEEVVPGTNHRFTSHGSDLRWKAVLVADPLWPRGPVVNAVDITYSALLPGSDDYEIDDDCSQAQPIETDGAAQTHTFVPADDEDWVRFEAQAGHIYTVQVNEVGENIAAELELYDACGGGVLAQSDTPMLRNVRVEWNAPADMSVLVRAHNTAGGNPTDGYGYQLSVRGFDPSPLVILVAATAETPEIEAALTASGDRAYNTFLAAGVTKARIKYFSPQSERDVDGNGLNDDVSGLLSHDALRDTIQDWLREAGAQLGVPVYLYLAGPAEPDQIFTNTGDEMVTVDELNLWLSNLEATSGVDQITLILEAPYSGSFIEAAESNPGSLSASNRVIITSSSPVQDDFLTPDGAVFSDAFFAALGQELSLHAAFQQASQAVFAAAGDLQEPWMDDNGDGLNDGPAQDFGVASLINVESSETSTLRLAAGLAAQNRGLRTDRSAAPEIQSAGWSLQGGQIHLAVQARDDVAVTSVVAQARPCQVTPSVGVQVVLHPAQVTLNPVQGQPGWYAADLARAGTCWLAITATDQEGNWSAPYLIQAQRFIYLPLIRGR